MFELTINNTVYEFKFGIGFVRAIAPTMVRTENGMKSEVGLQNAIADIIDGNPLGLIDVLLTANRTQNPKVSRADLEAYIEDESTDIDALFAEVLDFLGENNATKKATAKLVKMAKEMEEKAANQ